MKRTVALPFVLSLVLAACGDDPVSIQDDRPIEVPGLHIRYPIIDGFSRSFAVYMPESVDLSGPPVPAIMVLHGFPPVDMSVVTRMNEQAEARGFVAIYPKSNANQEWAMACDRCSPNAAAGVDDIHFLGTVIDAVVANANVDPKRVSLTGFSNGGMMTYLAACDLVDRIAGFAPVGAGMWTWHMDHCATSPSAPILMINGTEDPQFPWDGVEVIAPLVGGDRQVPILDHVARWASTNGCGAQPAVIAVPDTQADGTTAERWDFGGCGAETVFYRIVGGGHTWPGMLVDFGPGLGTKSLDIDATDEIATFLLRQHR